jgi:hypothetical protein
LSNWKVFISAWKKVDSKHLCGNNITIACQMTTQICLLCGRSQAFAVNVEVLIKLR